MSYVQRAIYERAARQFETFLTKEIGHINCAIGPKLMFNEKSTGGFLPPTDTLDGKEMELNICGRELILYNAPGETDDQIVVYLPKERILCPMDNIYKAFPNLYAIRYSRLQLHAET